MRVKVAQYLICYKASLFVWLRIALGLLISLEENNNSNFLFGAIFSGSFESKVIIN